MYVLFVVIMYYIIEEFKKLGFSKNQLKNQI